MTDTLERPRAPEDDEEPRQPFLGLSPFQLIGGALAAITTAVVSSFLGVAGTLVGAALASILSTVAGAVYSQSMSTAHGRLVTGLRHNRTGHTAQEPVALRTEKLPTSDAGRQDADDPYARTAAYAMDRADGAIEVDTRGGFWQRLRGAVGRVSMRAWLGTAAVFLMAIVAITGFELATGKPVSATVTGSTSSGTTISSVVSQDMGSTTQETPGTTDPSAEPTADPTATPTATDGQTQQSDAVPDATATDDAQGSVPEQTQQSDPEPAQTQQPTQTQEPAPPADPGATPAG